MENAQPEPSMEEILASIRRIISEDDEDGGANPEESSKSSSPGSGKSPISQSEPTRNLGAQEKSATGAETEPNRDAADIDKASGSSDEAVASAFDTLDAENDAKEEAIEMIRENVIDRIEPAATSAILDSSSASAASQAFENLSQSVRVDAGDGRTLEDIVVQILKPMLKEWLDSNLPAIVTEKVEDEVQRLARRRR